MFRSQFHFGHEKLLAALALEPGRCLARARVSVGLARERGRALEIEAILVVLEPPQGGAFGSAPRLFDQDLTDDPLVMRHHRRVDPGLEHVRRESPAPIPGRTTTRETAFVPSRAVAETSLAASPGRRSGTPKPFQATRSIARESILP